MQNVNKKFRSWGILLLLLFFAVGVSVLFNASDVQAKTKTGFVTINGKSYYIKEDGSKLKGWLELNGKKYYFNKRTGVQVKGWVKNSKGQKRYFSKGAGVMLTGWVTDSKGQKRYFNTRSGKMVTGWKTINYNKYYFAKSTGVMATGEVTINGKKYKFNSNGVMIDTTSPTGTKTIKNYLAGALQPVGKALYVWGGGWNDSTRKGLSDTMTSWYNKWSANPSSYDYNNYRDLSTSNRAKGFDCSGFVGWSAYQVMQTQSGVGYGYTVVSGEIGSYYKGKGWGSIVNQSYLSQNGWELKPGDIGYNDGHTWIVLGQCSDKSVVIIHSTPQAGVQISGTTTPTGSYSSEAVALAKKYMSLYSGYSIFNYHPSVGNYIRNGNYLRWNGDTLSDPDGYYNMTADQILYDLFGK